MKVLVVGGGGREHALCWKLAQSPILSALHAAPGSDAISQLAQCHPYQSASALADLCRSESIDLTVVGPEAPLVEGLVDTFQERGLAVFGPRKYAAQLEGSKGFAKEFMQRPRLRRVQ